MSGGWITGYGATTPVGGNTAQSCAALRAGICRFRPTDRHLCRPADENDPELEAPVVGAVAEIDPATEGMDRLLGLALPALGEALRGAGVRRADLSAMALHLVLPARSRPDPTPDPAAFARELFRRAALPQPGLASAAADGQAGFAAAVETVLSRFDHGERAPSILLAVDSLLDRRMLRVLDAADRLKCTRSPEGLVPGEGAAVLVLGHPAGARARSARASILAAGRAREEATVHSDRACTGVGLSAAIRTAARILPAAPTPPWVILDQNGERYRALEWSYAVTRCHDLFPDLRQSWYLADCLGDTGAATGGIAACRVAAAFERGYAPGPAAFVLLGSDDGDRGAVIMGGPPAAGR